MLPSSIGGHPVWLFKPAFIVAIFIKDRFHTMRSTAVPPPPEALVPSLLSQLANAASYERLDKEKNRPVALSCWVPAIHYEYSSCLCPSCLRKRLISSLIWRCSHPMACPAHGNVPAQANGDLYRKSCFLYRSRLICIENRVFYTCQSPESASHDPAQPA